MIVQFQLKFYQMICGIVSGRIRLHKTIDTYVYLLRTAVSIPTLINISPRVQC